MTAAAVTKTPIVLDRTFRAPTDKVWRMWTTAEGLARWWGPEGFTSAVKHVDVRVGGGFEIAMTAVHPPIVEMLTKSGIPVTSFDRGKYTEVIVARRLAWKGVVDFVTDVAPYEANTVVDMSATPDGGTRVVVTLDRMHDDHWTRMKTMGWEGQLTKLAALV